MQSDDRKLLMSIMTSRHSAELTRRLREHKRHFVHSCIFCLKLLTRSLIHCSLHGKQKKIWFGRLGLDVLQNLLVGFHKINKCSSDYGYDYGNSVPNNDLIVIHASWSGMITVNSFVGLFDTFESNGQRMKRKDSERFPCEGEWLFMATHLLDSSAW